ncbi:beta-ketoacyl-[acyl-carrier-protein] synthase family protein [Rathayibacter toxicus]|nr:beta-ketoacyl-[acyl-carrier-protein] synthase family protein [Rathayibacter toxicus]QWL25827.1 beta-ketoacyl-[acyl-carrier-protein] synthase family protein [Rathayibacter toxicus]QWL30011.1 beta-ketoacyl-[acyl-carrier-protein] synthase family protein [Rathayibacter toxicus]QWL32102.1 beta-ketoacyl-[acyl-carrier-protein] synthase family protein [Rathayibacter toxicus]QWL34196.1 beta-ketoacyl-[acyl-carrier-protein] synthase family protein [Rathayibacter toxicus]
MMRRRVAVVGIGAISAAGLSARDTVDNLQETRSFIARDSVLSDAVGEPVATGHVSAASFENLLSASVVRRSDRAVVLGLVASAQAIEMSQWESANFPEKTFICVGSGAGGLASAESIISASCLNGVKPGPFATTKTMINATAAAIALTWGIHGPADTIATACASGTSAMGIAFRSVRDGYAEVAIAGGADSPLTPTTVRGFARMGALAPHKGVPSERSRPFDAGRSGFVLAEGAAFVVLENWAHAEQRGASIVGEILGYASNSDAYNIVSPEPDAIFVRRCIGDALSDAHVRPQDVSHVNAHGTGTILNDRSEALAIRSVFGARTPVTAYKGATGHFLGGSGAFEVSLDFLCTREGFIPGIANLTHVDPELGINVLTEPVAVASEQPFISNSFGFGGHNACLVARAIV